LTTSDVIKIDPFDIDYITPTSVPNPKHVLDQLSLLRVSFWDIVLVKRDIVALIQLVKNCMSTS